MQPITLKLSYQQAAFMKGCIEYALLDVDEREYVVNNDLEGLLVLATLRPLYVKLVNMTALKYIKPKALKLEPTTSIAIHRMFNCFVDVSEKHVMYTEIITLCNLLHQYAILAGEYLKISGKQSPEVLSPATPALLLSS